MDTGRRLDVLNGICKDIVERYLETHRQGLKPIDAITHVLNSIGYQVFPLKRIQGAIMSWAAHDPEMYEEICIRGVTRYLAGRIGEELTDEQYTSLGSIVGHINEDHPKLFTTLLKPASGEIRDCESDYFMDLGEAYGDQIEDR